MVGTAALTRTAIAASEATAHPDASRTVTTDPPATYARLRAALPRETQPGTGWSWLPATGSVSMGDMMNRPSNDVPADTSDPTGTAEEAGRPVAVVTGANKGIGRHIAGQLARAGLTVFAGSRDADRGRRAVAELAATEGDVRLLLLDVTDAASIADAASAVERECGHLDVLVNNAGIGVGFSSLSQVKLDDMRATYETNVFGVVATTNAFLPLLHRAPAGRIVNITSGMGTMHDLTDATAGAIGVQVGSYSSSKTALNAITVLYATELAESSVTVNAVTPGWRATGLGGGTSPDAGDPAEGAEGAVRVALASGEDPPNGLLFEYDGSHYPW